MPIETLRKTVLASLMAALIAVGAYIHIPLGPVPIVLQNYFVLLAGLLLGARWGASAVAVYVLLGAIGLPVFHGGKAGIGHLLGPTGGYLAGFVAAAFVAGWIAERAGDRASGRIAAVLAGTLVIYLFGVPWLKAVTLLSWNKALVAGMVPFLPGDALKATAAVLTVRTFKTVIEPRAQTDLP
jgi:biotin transport system substrate-specific component